MINVGDRYFVCDECPLSEVAAHRLRVAQEAGVAPQFEYCGCNKVQAEFFAGGCCEDAYVDKPRGKKKGKRKTGAQYRRAMAVKHRDDLMRLINNCSYIPWAGYVDWDWRDGVWEQVGKYIKYPKNSNAQRYWKRHSNKIVRKRKEAFRGNQYRKCFDYRWMLC